MSPQLLWGGLFVCVVVIVVLVQLPQRPRRLSGSGLVRAKPLLTGNEREFYGRLRRALPDYEVLPQVAMGALIDVNLPSSHPHFWPLRRLFHAKVCDFVITTKRQAVVCVVELDDRSHDTKRAADAHRDAMLRQAGIPTLRWDSRAKPTEQAIAQRVDALGAARRVARG